MGMTLLPPPTGPHHLYVVISDPTQSQEEVVLVNISTVKASLPTDSSCIIKPGEHSYVTATSYVVYAAAPVTTCWKIEQGARGGLLSYSTPMDDDILKRIQVGADRSLHTKQRVRELLRSQGLIAP